MTGRRQATGKGQGLFFCLMGAFLIVFCGSSVGLLWLTQLAAPKRAALHDELRGRTGFKGPLLWYASERSEVGAKLAERFVDFAFSYPAGWTLDTHTGEDQDNVFVSARRTAGQGSVPQESFAVAPSSSPPVGELTQEAALFELKSKVKQFFPRHEILQAGNRTVGPYAGYGYDFAVNDEMGKRTGSFGSAIVFSPAVTRQAHGVVVILAATADRPAVPFDDVAKQGELPVLAQSFRLGLDHRHKRSADIRAASAGK